MRRFPFGGPHHWGIIRAGSPLPKTTAAIVTFRPRPRPSVRPSSPSDCHTIGVLVMAGRVGANIAAELGTMKVTEQVDALETLAYDPHSYLVVPRVVAASVMFPIIVAMASALGIVTGWLTAINMLELSTFEFFKGIKMFYQDKDIWYGLVKSISFGFVIALIGCSMGLSVRGGAEGVGRATTKAVVYGAAMILVLDALWAMTVV